MKKKKSIILLALIIFSIGLLGCGGKKDKVDILEEVLTSKGGTWKVALANSKGDIIEKESDFEITFYKEGKARGVYNLGNCKEESIDFIYKINSGTLEIFPEFKEENLEKVEERLSFKEIKIKNEGIIQTKCYENNNLVGNLNFIRVDKKE